MVRIRSSRLSRPLRLSLLRLVMWTRTSRQTLSLSRRRRRSICSHSCRRCRIRKALRRERRARTRFVSKTVAARPFPWNILMIRIPREMRSLVWSIRYRVVRVPQTSIVRRGRMARSLQVILTSRLFASSIRRITSRCPLTPSLS